MKISGTQYTLSMQSLDIYISGCKPPHCPDCHNPEGWDFNIGEEFGPAFSNKLVRKYDKFYDLIQNIMIFGGEPLDSDHKELLDLLQFINVMTINKAPIWLFTRYSLEEVPDFIKNQCEYIKCGKYDKNDKGENQQYGITLASNNQTIYKRNKDF